MTREILEIALRGLQIQRQKVDKQIADVRSLLEHRPGGRPPRAGAVTQMPKKRVLSPEARKRMAAAQRKRWAAVRGAHGGKSRK